MLKTLEEDREFRYSLMGLLGFKEVLDRITKIEEKVVEILERQQKLEERQLELEERIAGVAKEVGYLRRLSELNRRDLSALTEALYARWALEDVKIDIISRGERVSNIYRPLVIDDIEVDLAIETDRRIYVVEVKIQLNHRDVDNLVKKAEITRTKIGEETKPILACTRVGGETARYAKDREVEILIY